MFKLCLCMEYLPTNQTINTMKTDQLVSHINQISSIVCWGTSLFSYFCFSAPKQCKEKKKPKQPNLKTEQLHKATQGRQKFYMGKNMFNISILFLELHQIGMSGENHQIALGCLFLSNSRIAWVWDAMYKDFLWTVQTSC